MNNADQISLKMLDTTARKALELNPENELAGGTSGNLQVDLEILSGSQDILFSDMIDNFLLVLLTSRLSIDIIFTIS